MAETIGIVKIFYMTLIMLFQWITGRSDEKCTEPAKEKVYFVLSQLKHEP